MTHAWSPSDYRENAGFVPALGAPLVERLAPRPGERILDLGCGDGALTETIVRSGATVVGIDASAEMVAAARTRGLDAHLVDARRLPYDEEFDGVLSNAVLHWIAEADAVLRGVRQALKPGGRFVAELGGHTNIASMTVAIDAVLRARRLPHGAPWYFPTAEEYAERLEAAGLAVRAVALFPRPTLLPTDMAGWFRTFGARPLAGVPAAEREAVIADIVMLLRPALCDRRGRWTADYVRLRVEAERPA